MYVSRTMWGNSEIDAVALQSQYAVKRAVQRIHGDGQVRSAAGDSARWVLHEICWAMGLVVSSIFDLGNLIVQR